MKVHAPLEFLAVFIYHTEGFADLSAGKKLPFDGGCEMNAGSYMRLSAICKEKKFLSNFVRVILSITISPGQLYLWFYSVDTRVMHGLFAYLVTVLLYTWKKFITKVREVKYALRRLRRKMAKKILSMEQKRVKHKKEE